jgi:hypothetical protein
MLQCFPIKPLLPEGVFLDPVEFAKPEQTMGADIERK